jgi:hypothetical protein
MKMVISRCRPGDEVSDLGESSFIFAGLVAGRQRTWGGAARLISSSRYGFLCSQSRLSASLQARDHPSSVEIGR